MDNINILNIKKDLFYFNEYLKSIENYDLIHLFRASSNYKENLFSDRDVLENWKYVVSDINEGKNKSKMQIYIHIPYCQEFCDFCVYYKQLLVKDIEKTTDLYVDYLIEKFKFYSPIFKGIKFKSLSVGGGTPSILNTYQIERLFTNFFKCFEFEDGSYRGIEFRPSSTSEDKLLMLKKIGFETIHFGVQSLDSEVLSLMNRVVDSKDKVIDSINVVQKNKFDNLIIHLIRGLKSDDIDKFIYTIDTLIKNNVNEIKIYGLITTNKYLKKHYYNDSKNTYYNKSFNEFSNKLLKILKNKFFNDLDYEFYYENGIIDHSWSIIRKNLKLNQKEVYSEINGFEDVNILGFGPSSRSIGVGRIAYEGFKKLCYNNNFDENKYSGEIINIKNEMRKEILLKFNNINKINILKFNNKFKVDIFKEFEYEINSLIYLGALKIENDNILFLEKNQKMRMLYVCFIYGRDYIKTCFDNSGIVYNKIYGLKIWKE